MKHAMSVPRLFMLSRSEWNFSYWCCALMPFTLVQYMRMVASSFSWMVSPMKSKSVENFIRVVWVVRVKLLLWVELGGAVCVSFCSGCNVWFGLCVVVVSPMELLSVKGLVEFVRVRCVLCAC